MMSYEQQQVGVKILTTPCNGIAPMETVVSSYGALWKMGAKT